MKLTYDRHSNTLTVVLRDDPVVESDESRDGIILDFDGKGEIVSLEILDASTRVEDPSSIEFKAAG